MLLSPAKQGSPVKLQPVSFNVIGGVFFSLMLLLATGCSQEEELEPARPTPKQVENGFSLNIPATGNPAQAQMAAPQAASQAKANPAAAAAIRTAKETEVPLYNLDTEELTKHPKWGPILQQLSQSCVAFYAAEKRVPGSVEEMKARGFVKEVPVLPEGMRFQIDAANYRVQLVPM